MKKKQLLVAAIMAACSLSYADAEQELNSSIRHLQELYLENDYRRSDMHEQCIGLFGEWNADFMQYATEQLEEENIPDDLKEMHQHDEDYEPDTENEFNPYEWAGELGADVMEDIRNMGF